MTWLRQAPTGAAIAPPTLAMHLTWAALALTLLQSPQAASACVVALDAGLPTRQYLLDDEPTPQGPPPAQREVLGVQVGRRVGTHCQYGQCTRTSCGSSAWARYTVSSTGDDLGYRLDLVRGTPPPSLSRLLDVFEMGGYYPLGDGALSLPIAFDEIPSLDVTMQLIVVDRQGQESPASAPIRFTWNGCTLHPVQQTCVIETGPTCSVSPHLGKTTGPFAPLPWFGMGMLAWYLRRRAGQ